MRRAIKIIGWTLAAIVVVMAVALGTLLIAGWQQFGAKPEGARLARDQHSPEWHDGHFANQQPVHINTSGAWRRFLFGPSEPAATPNRPLPIVRTNSATWATPPASGLRITWFGHSSTLVELDGVTGLIDPFWSERASPFTWAGPQRWYPPPLAIQDLPRIDAVVISHDHYDHLDRTAILALDASRTVFIVPLGVGAHLASWGVDEKRIVELDWWQSTHLGALEIVATPARHRSGRTFTQTDATLWAGYALVGARHRLWYSGDTGFHQDLPSIGERLGPFDVTLIESGQYNRNWPDVHLGPEHAVEAHRLVRGRVMIPVHWGLLKLAEHAWTEPVERVLAAAKCYSVEVRTPRPGESIEPLVTAASERWWPREFEPLAPARCSQAPSKPPGD